MFVHGGVTYSSSDLKTVLQLLQKLEMSTIEMSLKKLIRCAYTLVFECIIMETHSLEDTGKRRVRPLDPLASIIISPLSPTLQLNMIINLVDLAVLFP